MKRIVLTRYVVWFCFLMSGLTSVFAASAKNQLVTQKEAAHFGKTIAQAMEERDFKKINQMMDYGRFSVRAARTMSSTKSEIKTVSKAFLRALQDGQLFTGMLGAEEIRVRYIRNIKNNNPLVRFDQTEGGSGYFYFFLKKNKKGKVRAVDIFMMANNTTMSKQIGVVANLMLKPSKSLIKKMFGVSDVDTDLVGKFRKIGEYRRKGDTAKALEVINSLPKPILRHEMVMSLKLELTPLKGGAYEETVQQYVDVVGKDVTNLILLDYYFLAEKYKKALEVIDKIEANIEGADGLTLLLKANTYLEMEEYEKSLGFADKAIKMDDYSEEIWWAKLNSLVGLKRFDEAIKILQILEKEHNYYFAQSHFEGEAHMKQFMASKAFTDFFAKRAVQE